MNPIENRTLTINKILKAPVELVWAAWTQSEHLAKWWAPEGMEMEVVEHDFQVGGKWKYTMPMPNGTLFVTQGEYVEIEEFKRIITTADFKPMTEGVEMHILFEREGDHTKFTFNVVHPTEEYCKQQEAMGFYNGWGSTLDRLDKVLMSQL